MAKRYIIECDKHGANCKASEEEIQTRQIFNILTGKPHEIDICEPEWVKMEKAADSLLSGTREVEVPPSAAKKTASGRKDYSAWEPMFKALKEWYQIAHGTLPRGQITPTGDAATKFFAVPAGAIWKDWEPGKPTPNTASA